jgi:excisionase family DNA binding protein
MIARDEARGTGDVCPLYMTIDQFAEHRQVSRTTIFHWISLGMPSVKQGRTRRIHRDDANTWLDEGNANFSGTHRTARGP